MHRTLISYRMHSIQRATKFRSSEFGRPTKYRIWLLRTKFIANRNELNIVQGEKIVIRPLDEDLVDKMRSTFVKTSSEFCALHNFFGIC